MPDTEEGGVPEEAEPPEDGEPPDDDVAETVEEDDQPEPDADGGGGDPADIVDEDALDGDADIGCRSCETPESEMMVVFDRNKDFPWKQGNPYVRRCPECGSSKFTGRSYWETQEVPYVIPKGEDEPQPLYECPHTDCEETFLGVQDECPADHAIEWE
jgi:hypothetical protein